MTLTPVTPLKAQSLGGDGARLVDIRSPQEFARATLPGAANLPLGAIEPMPDERSVVFICRTGRRSEMNAVELASLCKGQAYRLDGGIEGWRKAGLPIVTDASQAITPDRQALILAGAVILVGLLFGWVQSPLWFIPVVLVAADLFRTGVSGRSVIASGLAGLPINRDA